MNVNVYVSELTHRVLVTTADHGSEWIMPDGETFDLITSGKLEAGKTIVVENSYATIVNENDIN